MKLYSFLLGALLSVPAAHAENLSEVYRDALAHDSQYASARAAFRAAEEQIPQARAGLLPSINASANISHNTSKTNPPPYSYDVTYNAKGWGISAVQPLFHWQNWIATDEAEAQVKAAGIQLQAAEQGLLLRAAQAYFDVLQAQDNIDFIRAQKAAIAEQLAAAKRSFEVGTATIVDTNEAQARYDLAAAQEIAAQNALDISKRALFKLTGKNYASLLPLAHTSEVKPIGPASLEEWVSLAEQGNLDIIAQQYQKSIADSEVDRNRAGHYPTLDLTASYSDARDQNFGGKLIDNKSGAIGLQLNIPIYQGGLVTSRTRQAVDNQEKALSDLENAQREARLQTSQAFLNMKNGAAQVKALEQAQVSSKTSLDSTRLGLEVGVRTNIDLLNAQQQLYSTEKDLAAARYNLILAILQLKASVGSLSAQDLVNIDGYLSR
jgi:outer membrane protein